MKQAEPTFALLIVVVVASVLLLSRCADGQLSDEQPLITSEFRIDNSTTRICTELGDEHSLLGADNRRVVSIQTEAYTDDLRKVPITTTWRYGDRRVRMRKVLIGFLYEHVFQHTITECTTKELPHEKRTGIVARQLQLFQALIDSMINNATDSLNQLSAARRRLLQTDEGEDLFQNIDELETARDFLFSIQEAAIHTKSEETIKNTENTIVAWKHNLQQVSAANLAIIATFNDTIAFVDNFLAQNYNSLTPAFGTTFNAFVATFNSDSQKTATLLANTTEMISQTAQRMTEAYANFDAKMEQFAIAVRDSAVNSSSIAAGMSLQILNLNGTVQVTKRRLTVAHETVQNELTLARIFAALLNSVRLDDDARRSAVRKLWEFKDALQNATRGELLPFVSREVPAQRPFGFVPTRAGEDRFFVKLTIMYTTFVTHDGQCPQQGDTDVEHLTPSTDQARCDNYQLLPEGDYVHLRHLLFTADNDFLLRSRDLWFSIYDLMDFLGPDACSPETTTGEAGSDPAAQRCDIFATWERQRCSMPAPLILNEDSQAVDSISPFCTDPAELDVWFHPSTGTGQAEVDTSITHRRHVEHMTTIKEVMDELNRVCRQTLTSNTRFLLHSSTYRADDGSSGPVQLVLNSPDFCSINHAVMVQQSARLPPNEVTLPYAAMSLADESTPLLFQRVSVRDEVEKYGTEDRDVNTEQIEHFMRGPYRKANYTRYRDLMQRSNGRLNLTLADLADFLLDTGQVGTPLQAAEAVIIPVLSQCEVKVMASVGAAGMVPFYVLIQETEGYTQEVDITITDETGAVVATQQRFDVVQLDPPEQLQNLAPPRLFVVGPIDCVLTRCFDYNSSNPDGSRFIYDPPDDAFAGGSRQVGEREDHLDYLLKFAVPLDSIVSGNATGRGDASQDSLDKYSPFAPIGSDFLNKEPGMTVDDFNRQEGRLAFDATRVPAADSVHLWRRGMVPDCRRQRVASGVQLGCQQQGGIGDGLRVDPDVLARTGQSLGPWGRLLDSHHIQRESASSLLPGLDEARVLTFSRKSSRSRLCFEVPGTMITDATQRADTCPSPQQIDVLVHGNRQAQLTVANGRTTGFNMTLIVRLVGTSTVRSDDPANDLLIPAGCVEVPSCTPSDPCPFQQPTPLKCYGPIELRFYCCSTDPFLLAQPGFPNFTSPECFTEREYQVAPQSTHQQSLLDIPPCAPVQSITLSVREPVPGFPGRNRTRLCWSRLINITQLQERDDAIKRSLAPDARARADSITAGSNLDPRTISREGGLIESTTNSNEDQVLQQALFAAVLNRLYARTAAQVGRDKVAASELLRQQFPDCSSAPNPPLCQQQFEAARRVQAATLADTMDRNLQSLLGNSSLLIAGLQLGSSIAKERDAVLLATIGELQRNISVLINQMRNVAQANTITVQLLEAQQVLAQNLTQDIIEIRNNITAALPEIQAFAERVALASRAVRGATRPIQDEIGDSNIYWTVTTNLGGVFFDFITRVTGLVLKVGDKLLHIAGILLDFVEEQIDGLGSCTLIIPVLCDIFSVITDIAVYAVIALVIIIVIVLAIQFGGKNGKNGKNGHSNGNGTRDYVWRKSQLSPGYRYAPLSTSEF